MSSQKSLVLMSDDLQSTKPGVKTGYQGINGHISQIPGLSPTLSCLPEEKGRGRRAGVLQSDSDYVKLAKQGGHKGLLWHEETVIASEDDGKPSLINVKDKRNPGAFQLLEPPFGTDSLSAWERDDSSSNGKEKENNVQPTNQMEILQSPNEYHATSKFKRIMFDKRPAPVDMSKLLSFGYAGDSKQIANTDLSG